jgi:hypothetical protein
MKGGTVQDLLDDNPRSMEKLWLELGGKPETARLAQDYADFAHREDRVLPELPH